MAPFLQSLSVSFTLFFLLLVLPLASASHADEGILNFVYGTDPDHDSNFQYMPGFVKSTAKLGYEARKFSTDVVVGFGQGIVDTGKGLWDLGSGVVGWAWGKVTNPVQTFNEAKQGAENFLSDPLGNTKKAAETVISLPGQIVTNYVDYLKDCPEGHVGRCIGKGTFEVITLAASGGSSSTAKAGSLMSKAKPVITHLDDAALLKKTDTALDAAAHLPKKPKIPTTSLDDALPPPQKNVLNSKGLEDFNRIALASDTFNSLFARMKKLRDQGVKGTERWEGDYFNSAKKNLEKASDGASTRGLKEQTHLDIEGSLKGVQGEIEVVEQLRAKGIKGNDIHVGKTVNGQQIDIVVYENGKVKQLIEVKNRNKVYLDNDFKNQFNRYVDAAEETGKDKGFKPEVVYDVRDADASGLVDYAKSNAKDVDVSIVSQNRVVYTSKKSAAFKILENKWVQQLIRASPIFAIIGQANAQARKQESVELANQAAKSTAPASQTTGKTSGQSSVSSSASQSSSSVSQVAKNLGNAVQQTVSNVVNAVKQVFYLTKPAAKPAPAPSNFDLRSGSAYTAAPKPVSKPSVSSVVQSIKKTVSNIASKVTSFFTAPKPAPVVTAPKPAAKAPAPAPAPKPVAKPSVVQSVVKTVSSFVSKVTSFFTAPKLAPKPASKVAAPAPKPAAKAPAPKPVAKPTVVQSVVKTVSSFVGKFTSFFSAPKPAPAPKPVVKRAPAPSRSAPAPSRSSSRSSRSSSRGGRR